MVQIRLGVQIELEWFKLNKSKESKREFEKESYQLWSRSEQWEGHEAPLPASKAKLEGCLEISLANIPPSLGRIVLSVFDQYCLISSNIQQQSHCAKVDPKITS